MQSCSGWNRNLWTSGSSKSWRKVRLPQPETKAQHGESKNNLLRTSDFRLPFPDLVKGQVALCTPKKNTAWPLSHWHILTSISSATFWSLCNVALKLHQSFLGRNSKSTISGSEEPCVHIFFPWQNCWWFHPWQFHQAGIEAPNKIKNLLLSSNLFLCKLQQCNHVIWNQKLEPKTHSVRSGPDLDCYAFLNDWG